MSEILRCEALTKRYGRKKAPALDGVELTIERGAIVGLLGPNGSGKTTLMKLLAGLLTPDGGRITICGKVPGPETKALVSYLPDTPYLDGRMTVERMVTMFTDFYADFRPGLARELLGTLAIEPQARLSSLSKGNREKVCLILAMSRDARLYLLDEPIAGVDPATRDFVLSTILENYNPEAAILLSTHLISDIEPILEDVVFLREGKVLLHRDVEALRAERGTGVDATFREVYRW